MLFMLPLLPTPDDYCACAAILCPVAGGDEFQPTTYALLPVWCGAGGFGLILCRGGWYCIKFSTECPARFVTGEHGFLEPLAYQFTAGELLAGSVCQQA